MNNSQPRIISLKLKVVIIILACWFFNVVLSYSFSAYFTDSLSESFALSKSNNLRTLLSSFYKVQNVPELKSIVYNFFINGDDDHYLLYEINKEAKLLSLERDDYKDADDDYQDEKIIAESVKNLEKENKNFHFLKAKGYYQYIINLKDIRINDCNDCHFVLLIESSTNKFNIYTNKFLNRNFAINFCISILFFTLIIIFIKREILNPLSELNYIMNTRTSGVKILHTKLVYNDEIHSLSKNLNSMLEKIDHTEFMNSFLVDNCYDAIFSCDRNFKIVSYNNSAVRIFGINDDFKGRKIIGTLIEDFTYGRNIDELFNQKYTVKGFDILGNQKTIELKLMKLYSIEGEFLYVLFLHDYTESAEHFHKLELINKELEIAKNQANSSNKAKSEFLANISHEIRTPVNGIMGCASILEEESLTEEQRNYVKIIRKSSEDLLVVINDVLDISKIESGKLQIEIITFDINEAVSDVYKLLLFKAKEKNIDLLYKIDERVPQYLMGDVGRIKQIIINLLSNAIKFTQQGYVYLNVGLEDNEKLTDDIKLIISVKDTGIGISKINQKHLFDKFMQADVSVTRKYGGTGLGLAISKKLAQMMGGDILINSEEGNGSEFIVNLMLFQSKNTEEIEKLKQDASLNDVIVEKLKGNVLLVEDNTVNQMVIGKMLEIYGLQYDVANNGIHALEILEKKSDYDLILMDCQMPEMDGFTCTRKIRANEKFKDLKIVAITAKATNNDLTDCLNAGMNDFISKPVTKRYLFNKLKKYLLTV